MRHSSYLFVLLALTGCQFTPSATNKPVTTNDVVGVWSFAEDYGKTTVLMTFVPSGVFTQQIVTASQTNTHVGKWSLDGPHLQLVNFMAQKMGSWTNDSMSWYFVDGKKRLEIFGGAFPDPDAFQLLKFLRAAP